MSKFELLNSSCADLYVDAVVNAANDRLSNGGGICGVIFNKAGAKELEEACGKYSVPLKDGEAVITPSFKMKNAKFIIHAVGPNFRIKPKAFKELFDAYYNSLLVLKDNNLHSISFPLISSSIFAGNLKEPVKESSKQCYRAYKTFEDNYPNYDVDVKLCAYTLKEMNEASAELKLKIDVENYINKNYERLFLNESFLGTVCGDFKVDNSFSDELLKIIDQKGIKDSDCYKEAQIDRRLFSKIRNGHKPNKDTCISLCIALKLDIDETDNLLEKAGYTLSNSILKDVIVSYFIENHIYDLHEINSCLLDYDEDSLSNYWLQ